MLLKELTLCLEKITFYYNLKMHNPEPKTFI
jgi:hypothetical protein